MLRVLLVILSVGFLSSCASIKKMICDCDAEVAKAVASKTTTNKYSAKLKPAKKSLNKSSPSKAISKGTKPSEAVVDANSTELSAEEKQDAELEVLAEVTEAMDAFLFKVEEDKFFKVCQDPRLDCYLNNKYYPKGKKKARRKSPPTMTGSKLGTGSTKPTQLRYEFFGN